MIKCPACGNINPKLAMKEVTVMHGKQDLRGVAYMCIFCPYVYSVGADPSVLRAEIVKDLKSLLRKTKVRKARKPKTATR